jgi:hypothetical protein
LVIAPQVVGVIVVSLAAGLVDKPGLEQQFDRVGTEVPEGRAVSAGSYPEDAVERLEADLQVPPLAVAVEIRGVLMNPTVVPDLVSVRGDAPHQVGERICGVAGNEER